MQEHSAPRDTDEPEVADNDNADIGVPIIGVDGVYGKPASEG